MNDMKNEKTFLYFLDDRRSFPEDIKKKFNDPQRYHIHFTHNADELVIKAVKEKDRGVCKIAIISLSDQYDQEETGRLLTRIRKSGFTGIILVCHQDNIDKVNVSFSSKADITIPLNSNLVLRIHNAVKKIYSEHNIRFRRKRRNRSLITLVLFILVSIILLIAAWRKYPDYF